MLKIYRQLKSQWKEPLRRLNAAMDEWWERPDQESRTIVLIRLYFEALRYLNRYAPATLYFFLFPGLWFFDAVIGFGLGSHYVVAAICVVPVILFLVIGFTEARGRSLLIGCFAVPFLVSFCALEWFSHTPGHPLVVHWLWLKELSSIILIISFQVTITIEFALPAFQESVKLLKNIRAAKTNTPQSALLKHL